MGTIWEEARSGARRTIPTNRMEGARNNVVEKINYNHHLSLVQTLLNSSTQYPPQTHTNDPIADSGYKGHYLYALTTIVHTRETS